MRSSTGRATPSPCWFSASRLPLALCACSACRLSCPSIRSISTRSATDLAFNTSISFVTNTNWQSYTPETTMSYLDADGRAHRAQFPLGRDRHRAGRRADPRLCPALGRRRRQFLGRYDPLHALRAAAARPSSSDCSSSGRACRRTCVPIPNATTLEGAKQMIAQGPVASPGSHQDDGHQWRRLLQRQFRASLRKSRTRSPISSRWC